MLFDIFCHETNTVQLINLYGMPMIKQTCFTLITGRYVDHIHIYMYAVNTHTHTHVYIMCIHRHIHTTIHSVLTRIIANSTEKFLLSTCNATFKNVQQ
jgi:hypothetical protein